MEARQANPGAVSVSTLKELGEIVGCSTATVSRALRDDTRINEETRSRIWQAAHDFGFPLGKYLGYAATTNKTIAVIIPRLPTRTLSLRDPFLLELFAHIGDEARAYGCDLSLITNSPSNEDELSEFFRTLGSNPALVLGQGILHDALNRIGKRHRNFVVWGARMEDQTYCSIGSDNFGGGYKAVSHLVRMGRKKLLFLGHTQGPEMEQRYNGFVRAATENGLAHAHVECRLDVDAAELAVEQAMAKGFQFDGIFCVNDVSAIGAINSLSRRGLRVPDDINVVGYDDIDYCRFMRPALSTVTQNSIRAARLMVQKALAGDLTVADSEQMPTDLIVRDS